MKVESINIPQKSQAPKTEEVVRGNTAVNLKEKEKPQKPAEVPIVDIQNKLNTRGVQFSVDNPTGKIKVIVYEKSSGKVIREIPSSEILKLSANMDKMMGIIFDKKV